MKGHDLSKIAKDDARAVRKASKITGLEPRFALAAVVSFSRYKIEYLSERDTRKFTFATGEALKIIGITGFSKTSWRIHRIMQKYKVAKAFFNVINWDKVEELFKKSRE